ncbi:MAG: single-stranded DNA-binding protein [bacterium]|nr:single-stranded DNA-binding protein [bacterium]
MASRSLNRVLLIGNLTRDPELKYTPAGTAVCTFGVATNRSWTTNDGQTKEETQFHRVVAWQKLAELCGKLLSKGRKVYLEGRITYRTFTGKDTVQRTVAEIVLDDFIVFSDGKRASEMTEKTEETKTVTASETTTAAESKTEPVTTPEETVNPDDIPF